MDCGRRGVRNSHSAISRNTPTKQVSRMIGSAAIVALGTEASGHWLDPCYVLTQASSSHFLPIGAAA